MRGGGKKTRRQRKGKKQQKGGGFLSFLKNGSSTPANPTTTVPSPDDKDVSKKTEETPKTDTPNQTNNFFSGVKSFLGVGSSASAAKEQQQPLASDGSNATGGKIRGGKRNKTNRKKKC
jgi:hypothetical protein